MKKKISNIIVVICFLVGIALMLYPTISNYYNSLIQSKIVAGYIEKVNNLESEEYDRIMNKIKEYNKYLFELTENSALTFDKKTDILDGLEILDGNIGYIEIPKIDIIEPIYYGASEEVLQISVGLLEGSSFPTGESSTHTVLLGHRGLPSSKLFTDLDKLAVGDVFYVNVLSQKVAYEVDQIEVVTPDKVDYLKIEEGKSYATLVTCTPYGINSHRLLVRGHKTDVIDMRGQNIENNEENSNNEENGNNGIWKIVWIVGIILVACIVAFLLYKKKFKNSMPKMHKTKRRIQQINNIQKDNSKIKLENNSKPEINAIQHGRTGKFNYKVNNHVQKNKMSVVVKNICNYIKQHLKLCVGKIEGFFSKIKENKKQTTYSVNSRRVVRVHNKTSDMEVENQEPIYSMRSASTNVSTSDKNKKKKKNSGRNGKPKHAFNIVIRK